MIMALSDVIKGTFLEIKSETKQLLSLNNIFHFIMVISEFPFREIVFVFFSTKLISGKLMSKSLKDKAVQSHLLPSCSWPDL